MCQFFGVVFSGFFILSFQKFNYDASGYRFLWTYRARDLLTFLELYVCISHQLWQVFRHYFFKYSLPHSLSPLLGLQWYECWIFCYLYIGPEFLLIFFFQSTFSLLFIVGDFYCSVFKFIDCILMSFFCYYIFQFNNFYFLLRFSIFYYVSREFVMNC